MTGSVPVFQAFQTPRTWPAKFPHPAADLSCHAAQGWEASCDSPHQRRLGRISQKKIGINHGNIIKSLILDRDKPHEIYKIIRCGFMGISW